MGNAGSYTLREAAEKLDVSYGYFVTNLKNGKYPFTVFEGRIDGWSGRPPKRVWADELNVFIEAKDRGVTIDEILKEREREKQIAHIQRRIDELSDNLGRMAGLILAMNDEVDSLVNLAKEL